MSLYNWQYILSDIKKSNINDLISILNELDEYRHKDFEATRCKGCMFVMKCNNCDRQNYEYKKCYSWWLEHRKGENVL